MTFQLVSTEGPDLRYIDTEHNLRLDITEPVLNGLGDITPYLEVVGEVCSHWNRKDSNPLTVKFTRSPFPNNFSEAVRGSVFVGELKPQCAYIYGPVREGGFNYPYQPIEGADILHTGEIDRGLGIQITGSEVEVNFRQIPKSDCNPDKVGELVANTILDVRTRYFGEEYTRKSVYSDDDAFCTSMGWETYLLTSDVTAEDINGDGLDDLIPADSPTFVDITNLREAHVAYTPDNSLADINMDLSVDVAFLEHENFNYVDTSLPFADLDSGLDDTVIGAKDVVDSRGGTYNLYASGHQACIFDITGSISANSKKALYTSKDRRVYLDSRYISLEDSLLYKLNKRNFMFGDLPWFDSRQISKNDEFITSRATELFNDLYSAREHLPDTILLGDIGAGDLEPAAKLTDALIHVQETHNEKARSCADLDELDVVSRMWFMVTDLDESQLEARLTHLDLSGFDYLTPEHLNRFVLASYDLSAPKTSLNVAKKYLDRMGFDSFCPYGRFADLMVEYVLDTLPGVLLRQTDCTYFPDDYDATIINALFWMNHDREANVTFEEQRSNDLALLATLEAYMCKEVGRDIGTLLSDMHPNDRAVVQAFITPETEKLSPDLMQLLQRALVGRRCDLINEFHARKNPRLAYIASQLSDHQLAEIEEVYDQRIYHSTNNYSSTDSPFSMSSFLRSYLASSEGVDPSHPSVDELENIYKMGMDRALFKRQTKYWEVLVRAYLSEDVHRVYEKYRLHFGDNIDSVEDLTNLVLGDNLEPLHSIPKPFWTEFWDCVKLDYMFFRVNPGEDYSLRVGDEFVKGKGVMNTASSFMRRFYHEDYLFVFPRSACEAALELSKWLIPSTFARLNIADLLLREEDRPEYNDLQQCTGSVAVRLDLAELLKLIVPNDLPIIGDAHNIPRVKGVSLASALFTMKAGTSHKVDTIMFGSPDMLEMPDLQERYGSRYYMFRTESSD